jgi:hypothetical protein
LLFILSLLPFMSHAEPPGLEVWQRNHPEASEELGIWVKDHPDAASKLFEWDAAHPFKSKEFVTWTITHPGQPLEDFVVKHRGWAFFDTLVERHRPATEAFMGWTRRHPRAAEALMNHSGGLAWAGEHLYRASWHMERPAR